VREILWQKLCGCRIRNSIIIEGGGTRIKDNNASACQLCETVALQRRQEMPYLNVRIAMKESSTVAERIVSTLMTLTDELLGKKPEVTSIAVDFVSPELWFVGGTRVGAAKAVTFYLDIKVTDGTNTKAEKAEYVKKVFSDFEAILGPIEPASYIVIHDVRADSWGFQGKTQEYRFIQTQSL